MKIKLLVILSLASILFANACTGNKIADVNKDAELQAAADKALKSDRTTSGVVVSVKDGVATIAGEVADDDAKFKAAPLVAKVTGIKSVTNKITVKNYPSTVPAQTETLTKDGATNAIQAFERDVGLQIKVVGGIREIPAQNMAEMEIDADEFTKTDNGTAKYSASRGKAIFTKYSGDGWYLTAVKLCCTRQITGPNTYLPQQMSWTTKKSAS